MYLYWMVSYKIPDLYFNWDLLQCLLIIHELLFVVNSWLRHPRIRENWKTVTAAFLLFVAGIGMCEFQLSLSHMWYVMHALFLLNLFLFQFCTYKQDVIYNIYQCILGKEAQWSQQQGLCRVFTREVYYGYCLLRFRN